MFISSFNPQSDFVQRIVVPCLYEDTESLLLSNLPTQLGRNRAGSGVQGSLLLGPHYRDSGRCGIVSGPPGRRWLEVL